MPNDERERLVEILRDNFLDLGYSDEYVADILLKNDVVPVVRCKECMYKVDYSSRCMCGRNATNTGETIVGLMAVDEDFYCGYGIPKERSDTE